MPETAVSSKWSDLSTRVVSAGVIVLLALGALFAGPLVWSIFVLVIYVLMLRELAKLCEVEIPTLRRWIIALMPIAVLVVTLLLPLAGPEEVGPDAVWDAFRLGVMRVALIALVPLGIGLLLLRAGHRTWIAYGALLAAAAGSLVFGQLVAGPRGILALVGIVVISDVAGYFAGRAFGGPKFWPRVSPKKTWSGTVAGWIGAGIFGAIVAPGLLAVPWWAGALGAVVLSFAGQMGDIAESWLKRRAGVKDSSALIPGHGGVLDRLDALVAVAALAGVVAVLSGLLP
ncbi:phosphatidate cytidylyltransferase [Maritimibacter sp. UBA3975]|uniref:phosphatidate cytidylyltransferase n=1 Tax=Maritimibacter sp. UBA3975 TaxID=1946833 RepID=UPI000C09D43D|nr:phosphatidate cytidylyltransferase [Maritimibacter sp. UBA3975]MAM60578.1 phosphatidate cytidylyltransferase [Maritimibacter sp.]|tara:strand:+ start:2874 stop:3731 length:858 start_codon:yes stop_codon:yes gene_type:complete